ncbi:hypothetical protein SDC9_111184 [bioreactor metagenome]|uniref:Uncharacterized protein n=1 Tax=bioreactor metagenome TaxID=1076179 RepID=A0A645BGS1_9ZZZZ|nr:hypothetical protein [Oscillospiraceae bacterium]
MLEWFKWFFDGLGTELIGLAIGTILGGIVGFRIGKHKRKFVQEQEAGAKSEQYQKGNFCQKKHNTKSEDVMASFTQKQTAGDKSNQIQIGGQDDA